MAVARPSAGTRGRRGFVGTGVASDARTASTLVVTARRGGVPTSDGASSRSFPRNMAARPPWVPPVVSSSPPTRRFDGQLHETTSVPGRQRRRSRLRFVVTRLRRRRTTNTAGGILSARGAHEFRAWADVRAASGAAAGAVCGSGRGTRPHTSWLRHRRVWACGCTRWRRAAAAGGGGVQACQGRHVHTHTRCRACVAVLGVVGGCEQPRQAIDGVTPKLGHRRRKHCVREPHEHAATHSTAGFPLAAVL